MTPRLQAILAGNTAANPDPRTDCDWQSLIFKQDRMYKHDIMRINYTTYDVRCGEDVIHTNTPRCDVMLLNPNASPSGHQFWYARVLGIYHVNAIFIGDNNTDYTPRRLEFLWVRWYEVDDPIGGWSNCCLDCVRFLPVTQEDAFGFIDPADVLRSCHLISAFSRGKVHSDGIGISHCAQDASDWQAYYVARCVLTITIHQLIY